MRITGALGGQVGKWRFPLCCFGLSSRPRLGSVPDFETWRRTSKMVFARSCRGVFVGVTPENEVANISGFSLKPEICGDLGSLVVEPNLISRSLPS